MSLLSPLPNPFIVLPVRPPPLLPNRFCRSSPFLRCGPVTSVPCSVPSLWSDTATPRLSSPARSASDRSKARNRYSRSTRLWWRWAVQSGNTVFSLCGQSCGWLIGSYITMNNSWFDLRAALNEPLWELFMCRLQIFLISPCPCLHIETFSRSHPHTSFFFPYLPEWKGSGSFFHSVRLHHHLSDRVKGL